MALLIAACDGELRFAADPTDAAAPGDAPADGAGCRTDTDCPFSTLHCDPSSGACVPCAEDRHCTSGDQNRCDLVSHRCVECRANADCEPDEMCDPTTRRCRPRCGGDTGGTCTTELPVCDGARGACACTEESCERISDRPRCSPTLRLCVECLGAFDCDGDEPYCLDGACVRCTTDAHCAPKRCDPVRHQCAD